MGFGDEGKGGIVAALVQQFKAKLVVKHTGGAQCAHHVVVNGMDFCHAQTGAGSLLGARTYLGPEFKVSPDALCNEWHTLSRIASRDPVLVDAHCPVLTPWHRAVNRLRELARGKNAHGSCGVGIGELGDDLMEGRTVLRMGDLKGPDVWTTAEQIWLTKRLQAHQIMTTMPVSDEAARIMGLLNETAENWVKSIRARLFDYPVCIIVHGLTEATTQLERPPETIIYEGSQGVLLDERFGFAPHTTWSDCTFRHAESMIYGSDVLRIGVLRAFMTRHGHGPFPTECSPATEPDGWRTGEHNADARWQGKFRYGYFDMPLARYAIAVAKPDVLAITCLDRCGQNKTWAYCEQYDTGGPGMDWGSERMALAEPRYGAVASDEIVKRIERNLGLRVAMETYGPTPKDSRMSWPTTVKA